MFNYVFRLELCIELQCSINHHTSLRKPRGRNPHAREGIEAAKSHKRLQKNWDETWFLYWAVFFFFLSLSSAKQKRNWLARRYKSFSVQLPSAAGSVTRVDHPVRRFSP